MAIIPGGGVKLWFFSNKKRGKKDIHFPTINIKNQKPEQISLSGLPNFIILLDYAIGGKDSFYFFWFNLLIVEIQVNMLFLLNRYLNTEVGFFFKRRFFYYKRCFFYHKRRFFYYKRRFFYYRSRFFYYKRRFFNYRSRFFYYRSRCIFSIYVYEKKGFWEENRKVF